MIFVLLLVGLSKLHPSRQRLTGFTVRRGDSLIAIKLFVKACL